MDKGAVLSLYKRKKTMQVNLSNNLTEEPKSRDTVELISTPAEEVGLAMVYHTAPKLAYAIILENISDISEGDTAANPGRIWTICRIRPRPRRFRPFPITPRQQCRLKHSDGIFI